MFPSVTGPGCRSSPHGYPRKRPPSPRVAVIRNTSAPSAAHFASVPPTPSDSSSGWASTASRRCRELIARLSFRDHRFQVLAPDDEPSAATLILRSTQCKQVGVEARLPAGVEREERHVGRPVEFPEDLHPVLRRSIAERERSGRVLDVRRAGEQFTDVSPGPPQERRLNSGCRRHVLGQDAKKLS